MSNFFTLIAQLQSYIDNLDAILTGGDTDSVVVNGVSKKTISRAIADHFSAIQSMVQGRLTYETKSAMDSAGAPPNGELAEVWNDSTPNNNGLYGWNGSSWIKSQYDVETAISPTLTNVQQKIEKALSRTQVFSDGTSENPDVVWALVDSNDNAAIVVDVYGVPYFPALENHSDSLYVDDLVWGVMDKDGKLGFGLNVKGEAILKRKEELDIDSLNNTLLGDLVWGVLDSEGKFSFGVTQAGRLVTAQDIKGSGSLFTKNIAGSIQVVDSTEYQLTAKGDCFSPQWINSDVFKFLSDQSGGELVSYLQHKNYPYPIPASNELHFFISAGQSLSVGGSGMNLPVVLGDPKYPEWCFKFNMEVRGKQWDVHSDVDFYTLTPLHETDNGGDADTHATAFCNTIFELLKNAPQSREPILFSCHGAGGASYGELKKGGLFDAGKVDEGQPTGIYERGLEQVTNAKLLAERFNKSLVVPALLFTHGEDDAYRVGYIDNLRELIPNYQADIVAITGQSTPVTFLIDQVGSRRDSPTATDQQKYCLEDNNAFMPLSKYFLNWNYSDGSMSHLTPEGYCLMGEYHGKAWNEIKKTGNWKPLEPLSVSRNNLEVTLVLNVPVPPLVIDTTTLPAAPNYGFQYFDDSGEVAISTVQITSPDTIKIALSSQPSGNLEKLVNGYSSDLQHGNGSVYPLSNIRDSDSTKSHVIDGVELVNWLVIFELEVN